MNDKKKTIIINIFLFALLFGLISLNKEIIRPLYSHSPLIKILTGSFPNFIAAYIISLLPVTPIISKKIKIKKARIIVYTISTLVFLILTAEELHPMWGVSKVCDYYDIIASGLGAILAILTYELILLKRKKLNMN